MPFWESAGRGIHLQEVTRRPERTEDDDDEPPSRFSSRNDKYAPDLLVAVVDYDVERVRALLDGGADVHEKYTGGRWAHSSWGYKAIHYCTLDLVKLSNPDSVRTSIYDRELQEYRDLSDDEISEKHAHRLTCLNKQYAIFDLLIKANADMMDNARNGTDRGRSWKFNGREAIIELAKNNPTDERAQKIFQRYKPTPKEINAQLNFHYETKHTIEKTQSYEIFRARKLDHLKFYLALGADPNVEKTGNHTNRTSFLMSLRNTENGIEMLNYLIQNCPNLDLNKGATRSIEVPNPFWIFTTQEQREKSKFWSFPHSITKSIEENITDRLIKWKRYGVLKQYYDKLPQPILKCNSFLDLIVCWGKQREDDWSEIIWMIVEYIGAPSPHPTFAIPAEDSPFYPGYLEYISATTRDGRPISESELNMIANMFVAAPMEVEEDAKDDEFVHRKNKLVNSAVSFVPTSEYKSFSDLRYRCEGTMWPWEDNPDSPITDSYGSTHWFLRENESKQPYEEDDFY